MDDMEYHYTIPFVPPSNNRYIGRQNVWEYRETKKRWELLIKLYCRPPKEPLESAAVTLAYCFGDRRRRDPDNYSGKMILDGLVRAGIIRDDSFGHIDLTLRRLESGPVRTEIIVTSRRGEQNG